MRAATSLLRLAWDALFLQRRAYEAMRDDERPVLRGLLLVALLGVLGAVVGVVGVTLEWGTSPDLGAIQAVVLDELRRMPWYAEMEREGGPEAVAFFQRRWGTAWQVVGMVVPTPSSAAAAVVTRPLGLVVTWLFFGLLGHGLARLFRGRGTLPQTLGTTALAASPQLLAAVDGLPYVAVSGVGVWSLLCFYTALRTAHGLSWGRAMGAAVLPPVLLLFVPILLAVLAVFALG